MVAFNGILDSGTLFQGPLCVAAISFDGRQSVVCDGEGLDMPIGEPWGDGEVSFIYYDWANKCLTIEIEQEEYPWAEDGKTSASSFPASSASWYARS